MVRSGFVLVNWLSLVAFLVANTPAGTALRALTRETHPSAPCSNLVGCSEVSSAPSSSHKSGCDCCEEPDPLLPTLRLVTPVHEDGPPLPPCPCPGGCAYCSVAKVPCSLTQLAAAVNAPDPGARVAEAGSTYTSLSADRSTPPPRV